MPASSTAIASCRPSSSASETHKEMRAGLDPRAFHCRSFGRLVTIAVVVAVDVEVGDPAIGPRRAGERHLLVVALVVAVITVAAIVNVAAIGVVSAVAVIAAVAAIRVAA